MIRENGMHKDSLPIDLLVHAPLHVNALLGPLQFRVEDHVFPGRQGTDEHVILGADAYVGFAVLFAVQTNLAGGRVQHPSQHLAETEAHTRKAENESGISLAAV